MTELGWYVLLFGLVIVAGFIAWYVISVYNELVSLNKRVEQAERNIDVLLQQRQEELKKLIDAVGVVMDHEEEVFLSLTEAREQAERAKTPHEEAEADQRVREALASFRARAEQYPELRSQQNALQLQTRVSDIEDQIAARRESYNEIVTQYNTKITQFPYLLIAPTLGYGDIELFIAAEELTEDVDIEGSFN